MRMLATLAPVFVAAMVVVGAQTPTGQQPATQQPATQQPATQPPAAAAAGKVTVSGCLKPGTESGTWILENAEMASAAGAAQKPAGGPGSSAGTSGMKQTYALVAKAGQDLKPHANHKIEVVGTVAKAAETPRGTTGTAAGAAAQQHLNVESFKMVSTTCP